MFLNFGLSLGRHKNLLHTLIQLPTISWKRFLYHSGMTCWH